jgi:hypothetical protein
MPLGHSRGIFALIVLAGLIASAHVTAAAKPAKPIKVDDVEEKKEIDMSEWFANGLKNNPEAATEALKEKMAGDEALAQAFMAIGQVANRQEKGEAAKLTGSEELVMPKVRARSPRRLKAAQFTYRRRASHARRRSLGSNSPIVKPIRQEDSFYEGHGIDCRSCDGPLPNPQPPAPGP